MKLFILFFLAFSAAVFSQENRYIFDFDYAQFGYDSTSNYVEVYYSFNQDQLTVEASDDGNIVEGILKVVIQDSASSEFIINNEWKVVHPLDEDTSAVARTLVGVVGFLIPKGVYKFEVGGRDAVNENSIRTFSEMLKVMPIIDSNFSISDVQLASKIIQDSQNPNSVFYKNSFEVVPMPTSLFGEAQPVIFHYIELYNLINEMGNSPLKLNTLVYNSQGNLISSKSKEILRVADSRVEVGTLLITKFPTDAYTMVITLIDSANNYGVSSSKRFFIYNPSVAINDSLASLLTPSLSSQFGVMSEEELDDLFLKSKYISTSQEIDKYEAINTIEGKREFMFNFWKSRDKTPQTPRNEFYLEYLNRIKISNDRYTTMTKSGWKTDRGRVFISYGEPSEIERYPNQIDSKPYEIWHFNDIEGGVIFVFADLTGFSDYMILHSTLRGELRDDSWPRRVSSF